MHLLDYTGQDGQQVRGVRVDLRLNSCSHPAIPADAQAYVSDRSAVGEQYVNLEPTSDQGPYLTKGAVLAKPGQVPIATQVLLQNLDNLVSHIDSAKLNTVVSELGTAFNGRGPALQALLDSGDQLLASAQQALPETLKLIDDGQIVLKTQLDSGSAIKDWARNLNLITSQLKQSDPDLNSLLSNGPTELSTITQFVQGNRSDLNLLLANLTSVNQLLVARLGGLEQILLIYPSAEAGGFTVVPGDGTAHFGLVVNVDDPPSCTAGYGGTNDPQAERDRAGQDEHGGPLFAAGGLAHRHPGCPARAGWRSDHHRWRRYLLPACRPAVRRHRAADDRAGRLDGRRRRAGRQLLVAVAHRRAALSPGARCRWRGVP